MVITPMYGAILHSELPKPRYGGWRLSHAVIHTRVYGQAAAVGSLVLVFGFKDARQSGAPFKARITMIFMCNGGGTRGVRAVLVQQGHLLGLDELRLQHQRAQGPERRDDDREADAERRIFEKHHRRHNPICSKVKPRVTFLGTAAQGRSLALLWEASSASRSTSGPPSNSVLRANIWLPLSADVPR